MRPSIGVDPLLLALETEASSQQAVADLFDAIVAVAHSIRTSDVVDWFVEDKLSEYLAEIGRFPINSRIKELATQVDLVNVYSADVIRRACTLILERANQLSELSGATFFIPDLTEPTHPGVNRKLAESAALTFTHVALAKLFGHRMLAIFTLAHSRPSLDVKGKAHYLEPERPVDPLDIDVTLRSVSSIASFVEELDAAELWRCGKCVPTLSLAIRLRALQLLRESGCADPHSVCRSFRLGVRFVESLGAWQARGGQRHGSVTLEVCARIVAGDPFGEVKAFMTSDFVAQRVRSQDRALAFRTHVTAQHEALRLMHWEVDGMIEFANVGGKSELKIF